MVQGLVSVAPNLRIIIPQTNALHYDSVSHVALGVIETLMLPIFTSCRLPVWGWTLKVY